MMAENSILSGTFSFAKNLLRSVGRGFMEGAADLTADNSLRDPSGTLWMLRILHQLRSGRISEHRVLGAIAALRSVEAWLRYNALECLRLTFGSRPDLIDQIGMEAVLLLLSDRVSWVRSAALRTARTMYLLRPELLSGRVLEYIRPFVDSGGGLTCVFLLSCLPNPEAEAILEENSLLKVMDVDIGRISQTNQVFSQLNLEGLTIGGQTLAKLLVFSSLGTDTTPQKVKDQMADFVVPSIRAVERLSHQLPTVGMEIHRAISLDDPSDRLLASAQALLANYFSLIETQHSLGESHLLRRRKACQLEMRVMPASHPVFKLIIDGFVEQGLLPDSKQHYYLSTLQGDLRKEIILLLVSTFFLDLPYGQGPQALQSFINKGSDTLSFPGCYTYIGITLDPQSGRVRGCQSNIINKMLVFNTQIVDENGEHLFTIPSHLYQTDVARKALLSTGALAYLKPAEQTTASEQALAGIYEEFRERLRSFYRLELGLGPKEAAQLLGERYRGRFKPPRGVNKKYLHKSVELLRERLLGQPQKLEMLAQLLDEVAGELKSRIYGPRFTTAVDLFYHGEMETIVPTLIELLYSVDADQRIEAAQLLGAAGGPQARRALEANLNSRDKALRLSVIEALAEVAHPDSLHALSSQLQREEDPEIRARLEALLGHPASQGQCVTQA